MVRRQNAPLRVVTAAERAAMERVARASSEPVDRVARAWAVLAVANGATFIDAAVVAGRRSGDAVGQLVARFNAEGLAALDRRHGGGFVPQYGAVEQARILREVRRVPDGLPGVSTWTILQTLWDAGYSWQARRTWCPTGTAQRKRTDGTVVAVTDPDTTPKQTPSSRRTSSAKRSASRSGIRTRRVRTKRSRSRDRRGSPPRNRRARRRSTSGAGPPNC